MMQEIMLNSGLVQMLWDGTVSCRFDLAMFALGLIGYVILFASRGQQEHPTKGKDTKILDSETQLSPSVSKEIETSPCINRASAHLPLILDSMESGNVSEEFVTAELEVFLETYPENEFSLYEIQTILRSCKDAVIADKLLERMRPTEEWPILGAFIDFYLRIEESEKACDLFELNFATFFDTELDENMEWGLLMAALRCGRQSLADHLLQTSLSGVLDRVVTIQQRWRQKSAKMQDTRFMYMGDVMSRLSNMFNERYPFEEHSDGESTCYLGDGEDSDFSDNDSDFSNNDSDFSNNDNFSDL